MFEEGQQGEFISLKNYIQADHGRIGCAESVTLTTHGDVTAIPNVMGLVERYSSFFFSFHQIKVF